MRGILRKSVLPLLLAAVSLPVVPLTAAEIVTNWVAFNDHRPCPVPIPPGQWGTALRVTPYDMRVGPAGNLTNFLDGQQLSVTMSVTPNGAPNDYGTCIEPYANTPISNLFHGIVDVANTNSVIGVNYGANTYVTLTFNNLDPSKHYVFRGTSVRGGSYPNRWTVATIAGADSWVDAHINGNGGPGVITSNNFPAAAATLGLGQAAYNSGDNREGAIVGWDFISPGQDGSFSIISSNYGGAIPGGIAPSNTYAYAICAMLLAEVEASPPSIVTQPAANTAVAQNQPFSLSVTAEGTPLFFQWYKEGVGPIAGATFPTYSVSAATLEDTGDYYVVVYNPLASVTSSPLSHVTVSADVIPPGVVTAFCYPSYDPASQVATIDRVIIEFSEPVLGPVTDIATYLLSDNNSPAAVVSNNATTVTLLLASPLAEDTDYTVTVSDLTDLVGNPIANGTNNPAPFHTWVQSPGNGLLLEAFNTGADVNVITLTSSPNFPNNPFFRTNLYAFDSRVAFPDDTHQQYGTRTRGVFIPPLSGDWVFFLITYDRAEIYINPNGVDAAGKELLLEDVTGNDPHDWTRLQSRPVYLRAGQAYYMEALQQVNTGASVLKVAARPAGTGLPIPGVPLTQIDTNCLAAAQVAFPLAPKGLGGPLMIVQDVADVTVEENHTATFSIVVSNASGLPMFYQWSMGGVDIPGANGPTYAFARATQADSGKVFSVKVYKVGALVVSRDATLTVVPDTTKPTVVAVHGAPVLNKVTVSFSELLDPTTATDPADYNLSDGIGVVGVPVLDATGTNVILTIDPPLTPGGVYSIRIEGVQDLALQQMDPVTLPLLAFVVSRGFALEELYFNITGAAVSDLTGNPNYPNAPDLVAYVKTLEGPTDTYDNYGTRLSGWILPPLTGDYTFFMCSDDNGSFRLSPNNDPAGLAEIAKEISYAAVRTWTGTNANDDRGIPPCNVSTNPVPMTAGSMYAFELLGKEATGNDNVGANWQLPGGAPPVNGTPGIPGAFLTCLADPVGASVTVTQQPASFLAMSFPVDVTFTVGASSTVNGQPNANLNYLWQRDSGAGFQDILGAYGTTYTVTIGTQDVGARFRCLVFSPGASATSDAAVVTGPRLEIAKEEGKITVSWPLAAAAAGLQLQETDTLPATTWNLVSPALYQTNGEWVTFELTPIPTRPGTFYRLHQ